MRKIVGLMVLLLSALGAVAQEALPPEVEAWLSSPVVMGAKAAVKADGAGFKVELPGTGWTGQLVKTKAGAWVAALGKTWSGDFSLGTLPGMGDASLTAPVLFLTASAVRLVPADWPASASALAKAASDASGGFEVGEGLTLVAGLKAGTTGAPALLAAAFGLKDGNLVFTGGVGPALAQLILPGSSVGGTGRGAEVQLIVPGRVIPPAFQNLPGDLAGKFGLTLTNLRSKLDWTAGTLSLSGSGSGQAILAGTKADFTAQVKLADGPEGSSLLFSGEAAVSAKDLLGVRGFGLTSLGLQGQMNSSADGVTGSLGLAAGVSLPGGAKAHGFAFVEKQAPVPAASLVLQVSDLDLAKLTGAKVDLPVLPKAVLVLSTAARGTVGGNSLPAGAQDLLRASDWPLDIDINLPAGVAVFCALSPAKGSGSLAKLASYGLNKTYLVAGSFGWDEGGKPALDLAAVIPETPVLPGVLGNLKFGGEQPVSFFIRLGADALGSLKAGVGLRGMVSANVPNRLAIGGSLALNLSPSAGLSGAFTGLLVEDWKDAFGLRDIQLLKDTGLAIAVEASGAATFAVDGKAVVGGLEYGAGGGASLLFSTGIPAVKGLALKLSAQSLDLLTPVKIGQALVRGMVPMAEKIAPKYKAELAKAGQFDFVKGAEALLPKTGPVAEMARFTLKDALLYIATPGMDLLPGFDDVGLVIKGTLYRDGDRLGALDGGLTARIGLKLKGDVVDVPLGIVTLKKPMVDWALGGSEAPHFFFRGAAEIEDLELASLDCGFSSSGAYLDGNIDLGDLGATANLKGAITGPRSVSLSGAVTLNPGKIDGVNLPSMAATLTWDGKKLAFEIGSKVSWENNKFDFSGWYKNPGSWALSGAAGVDDGSKSFEIEDITVAKIKVAKKGSISLALSPKRASIKARGSAEITVLSFPGFKGFTTDWDFDQELEADLKIKKTVKVFNPIKLREENFTINYRIFP